MSTIVTVAPTVEPIGIDDVKNHLNLLNNDHDQYLSTLIVAARRLCETHTHQTAIATTFETSFDGLPSCGELVLDAPPLQSVTSIYYTNSDGVSTLLATSEYVLKTDSLPGKILRAYEKTWPIVRTQGVARPVIVTHVSGYATADDVPQEFKQAMLLMIGHWWMVRESVAMVNFSEVPMSAKALLSSVWHGDYP